VPVAGADAAAEGPPLCQGDVIPLAMFFPASIALVNTPAARFMNPTVSAIALADTLPARSLSSTVSVKRVNTLAGEARSAYCDSRNSA
jgi:hypothetical protein